MKSKIILLLLILSNSYFVNSQSLYVFRHCATTSNINGELTEIDDIPEINNNPNLQIMVNKVRVDDNGTIVNNPHYVGIRYNYLTGKWYIHNENPAYDIPDKSCYNIIVSLPTDPESISHKATLGSIQPGSSNVSEIDDPEINDNSAKRCIWTRERDSDEVQNNLPYECYYNYGNPGKWLMSTTSADDVPIDSAFNLLCNPTGFSLVEHQSTFENTDSEVNSINDYSYWTILDDVLLNNNPNALIFVAHRREPSTSFIYRSLSIFYNSVTGKWQLHIELENYISGFSFPIGNFFDIFIWDESLKNSDYSLIETIKVFPNPSKDIFNIKAQKPITSVSIFNMLGQKMNNISGRGNNKLQIDVSHLAFGSYFAQVKIGNNIETIKLVKN